MIGSETDRLAHLVTQLLDLGRISERRLDVDLRPLALDALVQQTLQAYRRSSPSTGTARGAARQCDAHRSG